MLGPQFYASRLCWVLRTWLTLDLLRHDRGSLTSTQKVNYINAVQCLMSTPARTPSTIASGAKSRFDDFLATHINQTLTIHYTANFLAWHRYFIWLYEQALKQECGYTGAYPVSHLLFLSRLWASSRIANNQEYRGPYLLTTR